MPEHLDLSSLRYCAAPMVKQSDLAFRLQTIRHGATSTWTQMYLADTLLADPEVLETLQRSLVLGREGGAPQVVQLAGNDADQLASAAKLLHSYADAIDLNLGCPQRHAQQGRYGAYLLAKSDWPLVESLVSGLAHAVDLPITTKIRLTVPKEQTPDLAGSSCVILHPRFASASKRRKGPADLDVVRDVVSRLQSEGLLRSREMPDGNTAVVSNGNVRTRQDLDRNLESTGASGVMVGETLLEDPALFSPTPQTPFALVTEYLDLRSALPTPDCTLAVAKQHLSSILCPSSCLPPPHLHKLYSQTASRLKSISSEEQLHGFVTSLDTLHKHHYG